MAASPLVMSITFIVTVSGTPSATVPVSMLVVRSERSMPDASSTSGPLEPSPGYGPAVSVTISVRVADGEALAADEEAVGDEEPALAEVELEEDEAPSWTPHAARTRAPAPAPKMPSALRRETSVPTSKAAPWSSTSSAGRWKARPSKVGVTAGASPPSETWGKGRRERIESQGPWSSSRGAPAGWRTASRGQHGNGCRTFS